VSICGYPPHHEVRTDLHKTTDNGKAQKKAVTIKANIDHLLGLTAQQKNKEMER